MKAVVRLQDVSKWYGRVIGVNQVTLEIGPGITGLLGPNGSGKSTMIKLVTGELRPSLGRVEILGEPVWNNPRVLRRIGYMAEADRFYEDMTGREFLEFLALMSGFRAGDARKRALSTLDAVGMAPWGEKAIGSYSRGMRQRVKLAQALVHDPEILILDEPLAGVDPDGRTEILRLFARLRDRGKTILISSHILHEVESITETIVLIARGRILASGALSRIRDLMDNHPLTVRLTADGIRGLAADLTSREYVAGLAFESPRDLIVEVRRPERFFSELTDLVLERAIDLERMETLDASATAIFDYLVGGRR